jgi:protein SYS1
MTIQSTIPTTTTTAATTTTPGQILNPTLHRNKNLTTAAAAAAANTKFHPKLIATQIVAIQCLHYFILTLLYEMNGILLGGNSVNTNNNSDNNNDTTNDPLHPHHIPMTTQQTTTFLSLDHIFTDRYLHDVWTWRSYMDIITTLLASCADAWLLVVIVEKSKKCLDFSITWFLCHLAFVYMYNFSFPTHMEWYILHIVATIIMILLGEHLCVKRELDEIPLLTL